MAKATTPKQWIADVPDHHRDTILKLQEIIHGTCPDLGETIGMGHLIFSIDGSTGYSKTVVSLKAHKEWVRVQFMVGTELKDPKGLLEGTGKGLRHIKYAAPKDIKKTTLSPLLKQAHKIVLENNAGK